MEKFGPKGLRRAVGVEADWGEEWRFGNHPKARSHPSQWQVGSVILRGIRSAVGSKRGSEWTPEKVQNSAPECISRGGCSRGVLSLRLCRCDCRLSKFRRLDASC